MRTQFFVTDGPLATTMSECSESYFREHLAAGTGGVRVVRPGGVTDLIAGSRYLDAGTAIRAEVCGGTLQVIYLGVVVVEYHDWTGYDTLTAADYPLGA